MKGIVATSLALLAFGYFAASAQAAQKKHLPRAQRVRDAAAAKGPADNVANANVVNAIAGNANLANANFGFGLPMAGFAFPSYGFGFPSYGFGFPSYGYGFPSYGFGFPSYGFGFPTTFASIGGANAIPRYDYTTDPFGGSPYGGNYNYWLTRQAIHGNISWAHANHRMQGH
jgi:hypothetical protein